jgi:hypothetical protein
MPEKASSTALLDQTQSVIPKNVSRKSIFSAQRNFGARAGLDSAPRAAAAGYTDRDSVLRRLSFGFAQARNEWESVMPTVYPCVPGHEIVGRVVKVGQRGQEVQGRRHCRGRLHGGFVRRVP